MRRKMLLVAATLLVTVVVAPVGGPQAHASGVRYLDEMFTDVAVETDIVYGEAWNSRGELQELLLDVYTPVGDEAEDRGLYIWAHGGNFRVGSKSSSGPLRDYVRRGWVGISIDYRLRPEIPGNAAIGILTDPTSVPQAQAAALDAQHDMQAAVRWARANADELGIDPNRIAVGGISAGAIMSLATAFNPDNVGGSGSPEYPSHVAAAVSHAGAYAPVLQGGFPQPGAPPVALYHGTNDEQVPYPLAPLTCVLTLIVGNTCELVTFLFQGHQTMGTDLALDFLYRQVILGRTTLQIPLVAESDGEDVTVLAGVEPPASNLGVDLGVVTPTDPQVIVDETTQLVTYALNALGIPLPE